MFLRPLEAILSTASGEWFWLQVGVEEGKGSSVVVEALTVTKCLESGPTGAVCVAVDSCSSPRFMVQGSWTAHSILMELHPSPTQECVVKRRVACFTGLGPVTGFSFSSRNAFVASGAGNHGMWSRMTLVGSPCCHLAVEALWTREVADADVDASCRRLQVWAPWHTKAFCWDGKHLTLVHALCDEDEGAEEGTEEGLHGNVETWYRDRGDHDCLGMDIMSKGLAIVAVFKTSCWLLSSSLGCGMHTDLLWSSPAFPGTADADADPDFIVHAALSVSNAVQPCFALGLFSGKVLLFLLKGDGKWETVELVPMRKPPSDVPLRPDSVSVWVDNATAGVTVGLVTRCGRVYVWRVRVEEGIPGVSGTPSFLIMDECAGAKFDQPEVEALLGESIFAQKACPVITCFCVAGSSQSIVGMVLPHGSAAFFTIAQPTILRREMVDDLPW